MAKTTNSMQYQKLVCLLEEYPEIAQGLSIRGKEFVNNFWEKCAVELNRIGPPTRDGNSWRKVWIDYKSYIKKKLSQNIREVNATGGEPNRIHIFTNTEEMVIRITGMAESIDGIPGAQKFEMPSTSKEAVVQETSENGSIGSRMESAPRRPRLEPKQNPVAELLKTQIEIQKDLRSSVKRLYRAATAKKKWRCIKDRYHRTKKSAASGSAVKDKRPYKYASLLSFLDRSENSNQSTTSNYSDFDNKDIITLTDNRLLELLSTSEEERTSCTNCCTSSTKKRRLVDETLINNTNKESIKVEQQIANESQKKTKEELFCDSLAIQIMEAKFPPERFRSVQRRILDVLDQEVNEMKRDTDNFIGP